LSVFHEIENPPFPRPFPCFPCRRAARDGFLWLPVGNAATASDSVPEEPEDVDFHGDKLLLYCGQKGGLYRIQKSDPSPF
jgi:hypothetical protein